MLTEHIGMWSFRYIYLLFGLVTYTKTAFTR